MRRTPYRRFPLPSLALAALVPLAATLFGCHSKEVAAGGDGGGCQVADPACPVGSATADNGDGKSALAMAGRDGGLPVTVFSASIDAGAPADEALPPSGSEDLTQRARHLVEAIAQDNPELAADILFPREAYLQARDSSDPAKAWEKHVRAPFAKQIHTLHKRSKGVEKAELVGIELGHSVGQISPKKKDLKKPLWRVRHSKVTMAVEGKNQRVEVAEMTSWRGAWYVTKLR